MPINSRRMVPTVYFGPVPYFLASLATNGRLAASTLFKVRLYMQGEEAKCKPHFSRLRSWNCYSYYRLVVECISWLLVLSLWLYLPFNVYLDSKRVSVLIEAVWPTLPMLYLPFKVYLDSKRVSILIEAVLPTLPMLYLPFHVYLDSIQKRVSIPIEAVLPINQCWTLPSMYILIQKRVTHRSSCCQYYQCCTFPSMYILIQRE